MAKRYFEFSDASSNKFWEVWVEGTQVLTRYGKIGANGQTTVKDEGSADGAQKLHDKLVREKTGKGYLEKVATGPSPAAPVGKAAPPPPPAADPPRTMVVIEAGFRRFEATEGGSSKFWEVKVEGEQQIVRFGRIGTDGQEKEKDFDSEREAKSDTKKLIEEKMKKGYVEVGGKPPPPSNPEMEAAIEQNLDDANAYLVYADWLQGKGDPLGELIVLQHRGATTGDASVMAAANAMLKKNHAHFFGALSTFEEGGENELELVWHHGFIKSAKMSWAAFDEEGDGAERAGEDLEALLSLPAARFIQKLELGPVPSEEEMDMSPLMKAFEARQGPRTLRELYFCDTGDWDISGTRTGMLSALQFFPKLEKLTLRAGAIDLPTNLALPELKSLTLETGGLTKEAIKSVGAMKTPNLESLELWFGDPNYGASGGIKDVAPIFAASGWPKLQHLGLMNCPFVDDIAAALPKAKVLKQLTSLDLSMGCLADDDIDVMVANKEAFAHLEKLNLDDNALTDASKPKVSALAREVNFGKSQDPDRKYDDTYHSYRYVSVGE